MNGDKEVKHFCFDITIRSFVNAEFIEKNCLMVLNIKAETYDEAKKKVEDFLKGPIDARPKYKEL